MLFSLELHLFPCLVGEDDVHALQVIGNAEGLDGGELLLGEGFVSHGARNLLLRDCGLDEQSIAEFVVEVLPK